MVRLFSLINFISLLILIESLEGMNITTNPPSIRHIVATLRTIIRRAISPSVGEPVAQWRLFNECSRGFLQSFLRTVNALGRRDDVCLTHFIVWMRHSDGTIAIQNARTRHFICLNKRLRPITMTNGSSLKCRFREHMNQSGYTLLESAWSSNTFLGFGKNGHSINTTKYGRKRKCFQFSKLDSFLDNSINVDCTSASRQSKHAPTNEYNQQFVDSTLLNDVFQKSLRDDFD